MKERLPNKAEKCFLTGKNLDKNNSLKFVLSPEREVVPDCYNKLKGKGFWIRPEKRTLQLLKKSKKLNIFFNGEVFFDPDMINIIEKLLTTKILKQLSLAKKAGLLVIGSDAIKSSYNNGKLRFVISVKGAKKLTIGPNHNNYQIHYCSGLFTKLQFEEAINKKNVQYLGILCKKFKKTIQDDLNKLQDVIDFK